MELLLGAGPPSERSKPFYDGMRLLGKRTPELSLIALRLVLAGRAADDESVTAVRRVVERVRGSGEDASAARAEYRALLTR